METPSGRNTDCKQLSKNIWKSKRADQVQSRLEETWTWDGAAASWPLLPMRHCSVRRACLEQHAEDVRWSLVSAACGSRRDMNSVAGPAALLTSLPPSAPASIPPSGPSPLSPLLQLSLRHLSALRLQTSAARSRMRKFKQTEFVGAVAL